MTNSGCGGAVQARAKTHRSYAAKVPSARGRTVNTRIQDIKRALGPAHVLAICRDWLPTGSRQGQWWVAPCPWRDDKKPSLGVSLTTGRWKDFAREDAGDMIDLAQKIFGDSRDDVLDGYERMLGIK